MPDSSHTFKETAEVEATLGELTEELRALRALETELRNELNTLKNQ